MAISFYVCELPFVNRANPSKPEQAPRTDTRTALRPPKPPAARDTAFAPQPAPCRLRRGACPTGRAMGQGLRTIKKAGRGAGRGASPKTARLKAGALRGARGQRPDPDARGKEGLTREARRGRAQTKTKRPNADPTIRAAALKQNDQTQTRP